MKVSDKNIIMITAGGVGKRFGSDLPKQYQILNDKPVIQYVIDKCKNSKYCDSTLVVAYSMYHTRIISDYNVDVINSGVELNITKRNGFDYIKKNSSCEKLVVVESVRPTIATEVIDKTFELLDKYDAVACARHIIDSLGNYTQWIVNREDYYTLNPPEGFRFDILDKNFDSNSKYTETIQQLPSNIRVYLNFDVPYFDKITYKEDLDKINAIIKFSNLY